MREDVTEPDIVRGWAGRPAHWVALDDVAGSGAHAQHDEAVTPS
jgi:hypothetical protein